MQVKLNPQGTAKLNFPGFQEILDFTSAGSEASVSVAVNGDVDKEAKIYIRNLSSAQVINVTLNTGLSYGQQYLQNSAGTITAAQATDATIMTCGLLALAEETILLPAGFVKTGFQTDNRYTSGTTIGLLKLMGLVANSTDNITSIVFTPASGNFTADTRIYVGVRRSNV